MGQLILPKTFPPIESIYTLSSWPLAGQVLLGASMGLLIVTKEEKTMPFSLFTPNPGCEWAGQGSFGAPTLPPQERAQWLRVQPAQREVQAWPVHPLSGSRFPGIQGGSPATRQTCGGNEGIWEAGEGSCLLEGNVIATPRWQDVFEVFFLTLFIQHHPQRVDRQKEAKTRVGIK